MIITIPGNPTRQKRARSKDGQRPYDPQKKEKSDFVRMVRGQISPGEMIEKGKPIYMEFRFYLSRPKSHYRTGKFSHLLKVSAPTLPCTSSTADLDNFIKFVKDCLNGLAYHDDCQVCDYGLVKKRYAEIPRAEILIMEIGGIDSFDNPILLNEVAVVRGKMEDRFVA